MREVVFLKNNEARWKKLEEGLANNSVQNPDKLSEMFIQLTDDLSYARTFYPGTRTVDYLNELAFKLHSELYKNKNQPLRDVLNFWKVGLPLLFYKHRTKLLYSFLIFFMAGLLGAFSAANDDAFIRLILGDGYVNMTLENIENGKPMDVYGSADESEMFGFITFNNIRVSFIAFALGAFLSAGTFYILFTNGIMLGSFLYFFYEKNLLLTASLSIWMHGVFEITAIVVAGGAGLVMGNSILFPKTFSRGISFGTGAREGAKIVLGLVPFFFIAGFTESFLTRKAPQYPALAIAVISSTAIFVVWYFIVYPRLLNNRIVTSLKA